MMKYINEVETCKVAGRDALGKRLYSYMDHEYSTEAVQNDVDHNYLTLNRGFDNKAYLWYADETTDVAICVEDGMIVDGTEGLLWWE